MGGLYVFFLSLEENKQKPADRDLPLMPPFAVGLNFDATLSLLPDSTRERGWQCFWYIDQQLIWTLIPSTGKQIKKPLKSWIHKTISSQPAGLHLMPPFDAAAGFNKSHTFDRQQSKKGGSRCFQYFDRQQSEKEVFGMLPIFWSATVLIPTLSRRLHPLSQFWSDSDPIKPSLETVPALEPESIYAILLTFELWFHHLGSKSKSLRNFYTKNNTCLSKKSAKNWKYNFSQKVVSANSCLKSNWKKKKSKTTWKVDCLTPWLQSTGQKKKNFKPVDKLHPLHLSCEKQQKKT